MFLHATTRDDKHWPETRWQELLDLLADSGVHIAAVGAPHEEARAKRLAEGREYVEVLPRMSLEQVAQVLAGARAVVSVDTGLSHLTAALDKPNFTLYGPTDPGLIGGYGKTSISCGRKTAPAPAILRPAGFIFSCKIRGCSDGILFKQIYRYTRPRAYRHNENLWPLPVLRARQAAKSARYAIKGKRCRWSA